MSVLINESGNAGSLVKNSFLPTIHCIYSTLEDIIAHITWDGMALPEVYSSEESGEGMYVYLGTPIASH